MPDSKPNLTRDRWLNKSSFILAAIGSAVGLGNFWRFPNLAVTHGGGLFLVPYVLSLLLVGIPLLMMELSIGQKFQKNCFDAFARVNQRFKGIAIAGVMTGSMIVIYYMAIIAWALVYLVHSFRSTAEGELVWKGREEAFFFREVLDMSTSPDVTGTPDVSLTIGLFVGWLITALCIFQGPKTMSYVVYLTMPLPIVCLVVLLVRAVTLPGADVGIHFYGYGSPSNTSPLGNFRVWADALGQIFFSLTLGIGVMPAYGSYNDKDSNVIRDSLVIAVSNSLISIIAGFVVFGTLGYMATEQGISMEEISEGSAGPGLAFIVFPTAIATLPGGTSAKHFFAVVFFLMLFTLGLDSAFSIVEAAAAVVHDNWKHYAPASVMSNVPKSAISPLICLLYFLLGLGYVTRGGLYYLDIVDRFMNLLLVFVGFVEVIMVGWFYTSTGSVMPLKKQLPDLKNLSKDLLRTSNDAVGYIFAAVLKFIVPLLLAVVLVLGWVDEANNPYGGDFYGTSWRFLGWAFYILNILVFVGLAFVPYQMLDDDVRGASVESEKGRGEGGAAESVNGSGSANETAEAQ